MIEKMKSVCVVAQQSQKEELLSCLRDLGILHIAEKKTADPVYLERFSTLSKLLSELKNYITQEDNKPLTLTDDEFEEMYQNTVSALERKQTLAAKRTELLLESEKLKPWGDFDSTAIWELSEKVALHFYRLDKKEYNALAKDETVPFIRLSSVEKMETVAVFGKLDESYNGIEFVIPEKGPVQLHRELEVCEKQLAECEAILTQSAKHLQNYSVQLLKTQNEVEYSSVSETLNTENSLVWLSGYIPATEEETFSTVAKENNWAWIVSDIQEDDANVPTKIRYGKLTGLIKPVFDILGVVPGYREYDISFWFLAFFALFFAMIIGDAGYGALFLAGTVILHVKAKKTTNITLLLYVLSATTIVWGALTGTWFGLEGAMKIPALKALVLPSLANYPQYFSVSSSDVQNNVMKFCFSIGLIQLVLACIMNVRRKTTEKNLSWIADVGWLGSISALYFVVLNLVIGEPINFGVVVVLVALGFLLVVLFGGMAPGKTFVQGLKAGLGDAFTVFLNTISAFGNVMSYIRLFAVGMASLAIAQSFNDMAAGFDGALVIVGAVIMVIGHLLNIVMGFLSVVVHGVRLNLLEFSGQLGMEWSGVAYEPFKKLTNKKFINSNQNRHLCFYHIHLL